MRDIQERCMSILLSRVIVDSGVVPPDGYERAPCSVDRNDRSDDGDQHDQSHLLEPLGQLEAQGVRPDPPGQRRDISPCGRHGHSHSSPSHVDSYWRIPSRGELSVRLPQRRSLSSGAGNRRWWQAWTRPLLLSERRGSEGGWNSLRPGDGKKA